MAGIPLQIPDLKNYLSEKSDATNADILGLLHPIFLSLHINTCDCVRAYLSRRTYEILDKGRSMNWFI